MVKLGLVGNGPEAGTSHCVRDCVSHYGCDEKYRSMLETIQFAADDTLYMLGDMLERGAAGFKIPQDMAARQNIIRLLGNHELPAAAILPSLLCTIRQGEEQPNRIFQRGTMI